MEPSRSERNLIGDERAQLEAFLDDNRDELVACVEGLTDKQARRRLVPSLTTPLGLLKHAVFAEKVWFHVAIAGRSRAEVGCPETVDESFILTDEDTVASVVEEYRRTCAEAREIAASYSLDDLATHNRRGPLTVRWIHAHMIEELARHAGHADILREQLLAMGSDAEGGMDGEPRRP
ncbi:MAG TPA: DinB family protein [Marmoricola sp.]|nr:DinB family protein [Marmoricola sp.]